MYKVSSIMSFRLPKCTSLRIFNDVWLYKSATLQLCKLEILEIFLLVCKAWVDTLKIGKKIGIGK